MINQTRCLADNPSTLYIANMKSIYSSPHLFMVNHFKNIVESYGIDCFVKNIYLSGGAGELPPTEVWPRLFVLNELDYERALQIVNEEMKSMDETNSGDDWICSNCGEKVDANFSVCWKCNNAFDAN